MSDEEVVCGYGECTSKYRNLNSLKAHQRKKHPVEYGYTGCKMRNNKRARVDEEGNAAPIIALPALPASPALPALPASLALPALANDETALIGMRKDFEQQIARLNEKIEAQQRQIHIELSSLMTEVIDQREHLKRLSQTNVKWCVVCFEKEVEYAFQPCGHKCVCKDCAMQTLQRFRRCPCCRSNASTVIRIFDISAACEEAY